MSPCALILVQVIFQHYVRDLEAVQVQYETYKHKPPVPRNAPPIAGNIMWSRQLLRRIEEPMQRFAQNKAMMMLKDSKKVIKMYNRVSNTVRRPQCCAVLCCFKLVLSKSTCMLMTCCLATQIAKALVEFETLWHQAWLRGIEQQRTGLQAPLLVRHPDTGQLLVNLDRELMQLIREAKYLQAIGVHVPEPARQLLLQEDKFKTYFTQLTHAVRCRGSPPSTMPASTSAPVPPYPSLV
jgi:dynein heavy chain, axonemal